jgi:hypothetical protein
VPTCKPGTRDGQYRATALTDTGDVGSNCAYDYLLNREHDGLVEMEEHTLRQITRRRT